jgi:hypothetical protein
VAEWSCSGLQSRLRRFDSDPSLQPPPYGLLEGPQGFPERPAPAVLLPVRASSSSTTPAPSGRRRALARPTRPHTCEGKRLSSIPKRKRKKCSRASTAGGRSSRSERAYAPSLVVTTPAEAVPAPELTRRTPRFGVAAGGSGCTTRRRSRLGDLDVVAVLQRAQAKDRRHVRPYLSRQDCFNGSAVTKRHSPTWWNANSRLGAARCDWARLVGYTENAEVNCRDPTMPYARPSIPTQGPERLVIVLRRLRLLAYVVGTATRRQFGQRKNQTTYIRIDPPPHSHAALIRCTCGSYLHPQTWEDEWIFHYHDPGTADCRAFGSTATRRHRRGPRRWTRPGWRSAGHLQPSGRGRRSALDRPSRAASSSSAQP